MKVCTVTHQVPTFGEIPAGSLWEDDSPYVLDDYADHFAGVATDDDPAPPRVKRATRKFGAKAPAPGQEVSDAAVLG